MFDPIFISITGYGLAAVALTALLAPFNRRFSMRADAHWIPLAIMAASAIASAIAKKKAADKANKEAKAQGGMTEAERKKQIAANAAFLAKFGGRLEGPQTSTRSSEGGGSSVSRTRGTEAQQQRQVVDPAQAAGKAALEAQLISKIGRPDEQNVSKATRAAVANKIAERERAVRETLGSAAAQRGVPTSADSMLVNMPAQAEATSARIDAEGKFDEMGYGRGRAAETQFADFMDRWKGQDTNRQYESTTNQDYTDFNNSTSTDPNGGLAQLYAMQMFSPGAQQVVPQIASGWNFAGDLASAAGQAAGSYYGGGAGGGGGGGMPFQTPNTGNNFQTKPLDLGIFTKKPPQRY
jgi:hypothetical protein